MKKIITFILFTLFIQGFGFASNLIDDFDDLNISNILKSNSELKYGLKDIVDKSNLVLLNFSSSSQKTLGNQLRKAVNDMISVSKQTDALVMKVNLESLDLAKYKNELVSMIDAQTDTRKLLVKMTDLLYRLNNEGLSDGDVDKFRLLMGEQNISYALSKQSMSDLFSSKLSDLLDQLSGEIYLYQSKMRDSFLMKGKILGKLKKIESDYKDLEMKKNILTELLNGFEKLNLDLNQEVDDIFGSYKDVYDQVKDTVEGIYNGRAVDKFDFAIAKSVLIDYKENNFSDHYFIRPTLPISSVASFYGDPSYQQRYGIPNNGVDLVVSDNMAVYAPAESIVYKISDKGPFSINRIVLYHNDGYVSVLLNVGSIAVKEGEVLKKGQYIGNVNFKRLFNVGIDNVFHFEVYKDGSSVDPLSNLDLSIFSNKDILPSYYHVKYLRNLSRRDDVRTNIVYMSGDSLEERRANFLSLYASSQYRDVNFWERVASGTNVDIDMGICIGFAESTLGNYLATSNNLGNVGNNDRGDRIAYQTPYMGARLIYDTLNNRFLGRYHTIDRLSGFGNKDGKVYASSPVNRQNNVVKCLSSIKGFFVPEDFAFRVGLNPRLIGSGDLVGQ